MQLVLPQLGLMIPLLLGLNELKALNTSNNAYSLVIIFKVLLYMVEKASYGPQHPWSPSCVVTELLIWG